MRSSILIAVLIVLATLGWVASGMIGTEDTPGSIAADLQPPRSEGMEAPVPTVRVARLSAEKRVSSLSVLGETRAARRVDVRAQTSGRVIEVAAEEGRPVEDGALLVELAMDDRMERLSRAEAAIARWEDRTRADQRLANRDFTSRQSVMESKAALEDARAALAAILIDIDHTKIQAPFAGIVAERMVEVGDFLSVGDPVARIVDLDPLVVAAKIPESDIDSLHVGLSGTATLVNGRALEGEITFIAPVADGVTRTFTVELSFPRPDPPVPEGMTARVTIPLDSTMAHRISPAVLGLDDQGRIGVKLVDAEDHVVFHPVHLTGDDDQGIWVEGLPDPATVIIVGQEFVSPGQRVTPVDTETIAQNTAAMAAADRDARDAGRAPDATIDSIADDRQ
ncbi:efflux RND transporter periplasmic adaptor subunit [Roseospira navarrensis]|uniref:Efflux RND transporter periplasmic adaptor subunit n=1 Tax=Roseospira navarrensis TaxID=140058 RepID=A0A7X1ZDM1_9PROT|nr:efflux RND transporter periplasmic adaptor subunit [Roseospira navarrensis]MQX36402.1 efflux RND transporter periplasmic adaptor subunit [Roseospira navarrensis]